MNNTKQKAFLNPWKIASGVLLFLFVTLGAQERNTVILQANESLPYWSSKLSQDGMLGEIVHAVAKEAGITTKIEYRPLKRMIADTSNNDLGNPLFFMERQSFASICPIAITYSAFFSYASPERKTSTPSISDRKPRIGILKGTISNPELLSSIGQFEESYTRESLFKKLKIGRLDAVLELDLVGMQTIRELFPNETGSFKMEVLPGSASPIAILLDQNQLGAVEIAKRYHDGLERIIQNGTYKKIVKKYYGETPIPADWDQNMAKFQLMYEGMVQ